MIKPPEGTYWFVGLAPEPAPGPGETRDVYSVQIRGPKTVTDRIWGKEMITTDNDA